MNCLGLNGAPPVFRRPQLPEVRNCVAEVRAIADLTCLFIVARAEVCGVDTINGDASTLFRRRRRS